MMINVNGVPSETLENATIASLVVELGLQDTKGIAVAVNGAVEPRGGWATRKLAAGVEVLVIRATQGG